MYARCGSFFIFPRRFATTGTENPASHRTTFSLNETRNSDLKTNDWEIDNLNPPTPRPSIRTLTHTEPPWPSSARRPVNYTPVLFSTRLSQVVGLLSFTVYTTCWRHAGGSLVNSNARSRVSYSYMASAWFPDSGDGGTPPDVRGEINYTSP